MRSGIQHAIVFIAVVTVCQVARSAAASTGHVSGAFRLTSSPCIRRPCWLGQTGPRPHALS